MRVSEAGKWIAGGPRRRSMAQIIRKPMTSREIHQALERSGVVMREEDVTHLIRRFERTGLLRCLNQRAVTGRLYFWTAFGVRAVEGIGLHEVLALPRQMDWDTYAWVIRAKTRKAVATSLVPPDLEIAPLAMSATEIRHSLRSSHPLSLNAVGRALKELRRHGVLRCVGTTGVRRGKHYGLTRKGAAIVRQILR